MFPKNEPLLPFVSNFPPIDVFLETKGNENGNEIVSSLKSASHQRRGLPKMETRIAEPLETKQSKNGTFRFLSFPSATVLSHVLICRTTQIATNMPRCEHDDMTALLSKTQLARRADLDSRTVAHRLKALDIRPTAMTANGRLLFSESALQLLKNAAPSREVAA